MTALRAAWGAIGTVGRVLGLPRGWVLILAALAVGIGVQSCRVSSAQRAARANGLRADSAVAASDTTRAILARTRGIVAILGDSLQAVTRRAVQTDQRADALDRAVGVERVARIRAEARVDSLLAIIEAPVTVDSGDTRTATFPIDQPPYRGDARVTLPKPPASGSLALHLGLEPASLDVRVVCGAPRDGIKPASVIVAAPKWLDVRLGPVQYEPAVCNAVPNDPVRGWGFYALLAAVFAGGFVLAK